MIARVIGTVRPVRPVRPVFGLTARVANIRKTDSVLETGPEK